MANILYGVNGEGAGHSTRAKEVLTHLVSRGHQVHVASFDRGLRNLTDVCCLMQPFRPSHSNLDRGGGQLCGVRLSDSEAPRKQNADTKRNQCETARYTQRAQSSASVV